MTVQVWNREGAEERLKCGGGLWSVAEVLFESIEDEVKKKIQQEMPGGSVTEYSDDTWNLMMEINDLIVTAHRLLCEGRECMQNDLDKVLREQVRMPTLS